MQWRTLAACLGLLVPTVLPDPAPAQPGPVVTETEYLTFADPEDPSLLALRAELGEARAALVAARTLEDPVVGVEREEGGEETELTLSLGWSPPLPGRRSLAVAAAEAELAGAEESRTAAALELRLALREVFARWAAAEATAARLAARVERLERLAERQRRRSAVGEASGLEARRLGLAAAAGLSELARAEADLAAARAAARALRPDLPADASARLPDLPAPPAAATIASAEAVERHPRVAALEARLEAASLGLRLARRILEPPELVLGWKRIEEGDLEEGGPVAGLSWSLPLFDRNRAERASARSRVEVLAAELALARREVAAERTGALAAYERLRRAAEEVAALAAAEGRPAVTAATTAFELGEADLTDLLETLRSATEAELAGLELRRAALAAHRELERAAGRPLIPPFDEPSDLDSIPIPTEGASP